MVRISLFGSSCAEGSWTVVRMVAYQSKHICLLILQLWSQVDSRFTIHILPYRNYTDPQFLKHQLRRFRKWRWQLSSGANGRFSTVICPNAFSFKICNNIKLCTITCQSPFVPRFGVHFWFFVKGAWNFVLIHRWRRRVFCYGANNAFSVKTTNTGAKSKLPFRGTIHHSRNLWQQLLVFFVTIVLTDWAFEQLPQPDILFRIVWFYFARMLKTCLCGSKG